MAAGKRGREKKAMIAVGTLSARLAEAQEFLDRCESALVFARQFGEAAWKIEGLEEAVADAKDAIADLRHLGV